MRQRLHLMATLAACCLLVACRGLHACAADAEGGYLSGADLQVQLRGVVSVSWSNISLRQALASLSKTERLAVVLDRRVDPESALQLVLPREPLEDILRKCAQHARLGYCQFGPVAYFGPAHTAMNLRTVAQLRLDECRALAGPSSRVLTQSCAVAWDELAEPRAIVSQWLSDARISLSNAERLPHDLWPAGKLPAMPLVDRLTLLLAEFDLTFELDHSGRVMTLVPFPRKASISRTYRAVRQTDELAARWKNEFPRASVVAGKGLVRVDGLLEDHEAIERRMKGSGPRRTAAAGKEVYQVAIDSALLDKVVEQLAERLSLEFQWDREAVAQANISTSQLVTINVTNADADALLRAVFRDTGLSFQRQGRIVRIAPQAPPDAQK